MPGRGRPPSSLSDMLESTKRQFFYLVYVLNWQLSPNVTAFFDHLFGEINKVIGIPIQVTPDQWQGIKKKWDREWNIGHGSSPPPAVLIELDKYPLWYDGTTERIDIPRGTLALEPQSTASQYFKSRKEMLQQRSQKNQGLLKLEALATMKSQPSDLDENSAWWKPTPTLPSTAFPDIFSFSDFSTYEDQAASAPIHMPTTIDSASDDILRTYPLFTCYSNDCDLTSSPIAGRSEQQPQTVALKQIELTPTVPSNTKLAVRSHEKHQQETYKRTVPAHRTSTRKRTRPSFFHDPPPQRRQSPATHTSEKD